MKRLIILLALASLACMTATVPSDDGKKGSFLVAQPTATIPSNLPSEEVGRVIVDSLHVRTAPNADAPSTGFLVYGSAVMGTCYRFADGSIWLGFDHNPDGEPTRFAAVLFDGERLMDAC